MTVVRNRRRGRGRAKRRISKVRVLLLLVLLAALAAVSLHFVFFRGPEAEKLMYPMQYQETIERYSAEYDLDPAFVSAIILCESSFQKDAVSPVKARGLMQMMPDTGAWVAGKFGEEERYSPQDLFDPETSIKYGCWFLGYLNTRFEGEHRVMAAAYHAGQNEVARWLSDESYSKDGKTLDTMPETSVETRKYVNRVMEAYARYDALYTFAR